MKDTDEARPWWKRRNARGIMVTAVGLALIVIILTLSLALVSNRNARRADEKTAQASKAITGVEQLCEQVQRLGRTCVVTPEQVRQPGPPPVPPKPSDEQVREAVNAYFAEHPVQPGRPPTPAEIAAAVINYLQSHPPAQGEKGDPGQPPTADQVADAVSTYLAAHPPPAGPKGEQGDTGPGPTADQIAQAVKDYIENNPLPLCPSGSSPEAHNVVTDTGAVDAIICVRSAPSASPSVTPTS